MLLSRRARQLANGSKLYECQSIESVSSFIAHAAWLKFRGVVFVVDFRLFFAVEEELRDCGYTFYSGEIDVDRVFRGPKGLGIPAKVRMVKFEVSW